MKPNWKKVLTYGLPALAAIGIIVYVNKRKKAKEEYGTPPPGSSLDAGSAALKPVTVKDSNFPLKQGSKNSYVSRLQTALGVSADGVFGPITEGALSSKAGITQVKDEATLNQIISTITAGAANTSRAMTLQSQFAAGNKAIYCTATSNWEQVIEDSYGALQPTGRMITLYKSKTYNNTDYIIKGYTKLGNLKIQVTRGAAAGLYTGNPSNVTLVTV